MADFRSLRGEVLDALLSANLASLMAVGVVKLPAIAQDGMRVRASAGASSLRREEKRQGYLGVAELKQQRDDDPGAEHRRREAARARAAKEREARLQAALERLPELAEIKQRQGKKPEDARASTTDAEASVMKRGDGGFRLAYHLQYGTDVESQIIVGVDGVTSGSDQGQRVPMVAQVLERCGQAPDHWLVDGGYPGHGQSDAVADQTAVLAPVPKAKGTKVAQGDQGDQNPPSAPSDPPAPKPGDSQAVTDWRERMATAEAQDRYQDRGPPRRSASMPRPATVAGNA